MRNISIINFKGGVGKTTGAINIAHILATAHGKRVLLIDMDQQGNASQFFDVYDPSLPSIADVLMGRDYETHEAIRSTKYAGLEILPANMALLKANRDILVDVGRPQQTRLKKALRQVRDRYDYVVIDNAPALDMGTINALVVSDDVIIPVKPDKFAFDGLEILLDQIECLRDFNEDIRVAGCYINEYDYTNVAKSSAEYIEASLGIPVFDTHIRKTTRVSQSTFTCKPLMEHEKISTAGRDYAALVAEYLNGVAG